MDDLEYFLTRFFDQFAMATPSEYTTWWLLPTILSGFILMLWVVHLVSKTHEWKQGQVRFKQVTLLKRPSAKFPKGHSARIIDFVAAGNKVRNFRHSNFHLLSDPSLVAKLCALNGKERDSFELASVVGKGEMNDDGPPHAA